MKIAIDISPLSTGHKVRGVGFYLTYLKRALQKYCSEHQFAFFNQNDAIPRDVDLVHYPYFDPFFITLPFIKKHKRVVTVHDLTPLVFPKHFSAGIKGKLRWLLQRYNLQQSDAIVTDSLASKKDIIKIAHIEESKVHVAYLAAAEEFRQISESKCRAVRKKYDLPEKFVLYVGDVTWNKNVPRLMEAVQKTDLPLVMVGKSLVEENFDRQNPWNGDLVRVQEAANTDRRFLRLGFVPTEDLVAIYNSATVFVFPSIYEGFGLPVLEAMQCGTPVVTTAGGSLQEVARDAALYVDSYSAQSIAEGIEKVFSNQKLQKELSEKGLQQAKKFSWEQTARQTVAVYEHVIL